MIKGRPGEANSKKKPVPILNLRVNTLSAMEQTFRFLQYPDGFTSYNWRWIIVRKKLTSGRWWYGVRATFPDTHENGLSLVAKEIDLARRGIMLLKKNPKKYLKP